MALKKLQHLDSQVAVEAEEAVGAAVAETKTRQTQIPETPIPGPDLAELATATTHQKRHAASIGSLAARHIIAAGHKTALGKGYMQQIPEDLTSSAN